MLCYSDITKSAFHPNEHFYTTVPSALISIYIIFESYPKNFNHKINGLKESNQLKETYTPNEILNHCYSNAFMNIKDMPPDKLNTLYYYINKIQLGSEIDEYYRLLDVVISLKPSPNRNTLFLSLIFAGAKPDKPTNEYKDIPARLNRLTIAS